MPSSFAARASSPSCGTWLASQLRLESSMLLRIVSPPWKSTIDAPVTRSMKSAVEVRRTESFAVDGGDILGVSFDPGLTSFVDWETFGEFAHPDNSRNTKLEYLKLLKKHFDLPFDIEIWVWW